MYPRKRFCAAKTCFNHRKSGSDLSFYLFPKDDNRCRKWLARAGRRDLLVKTTGQVHKSGYLICSEHFEETQFSTGSRKRLIKNAMPTLFSLNPTGACFGPYQKETVLDASDDPAEDDFQESTSEEDVELTDKTSTKCSENMEIPVTVFSKKTCLYKCSLCHLTFPGRDKLAAHVKDHQSDKSDFNHIVTYTGEIVFSCKVCRQVFSEKPEYCRHYKSLDPCRLCCSLFHTETSCRRFQRVHLNNNTGCFEDGLERENEVADCSKENSLDEISQEKQETLTKLNNGIKSTSDTVSCALKKKDQYVCTGCYKWFSTQKEFVLHVARAHKVQNPSSLQLIIKMNERVYSCKGCQKVFTDDKEICEQCVYRCSFCNKSFSQLSSCKRHESNAHKNKISQMVTESKDKEPANVEGLHVQRTGTTREEVLNCNSSEEETYILPTPHKNLISNENPLAFKSEHLLSDNVQVKDEPPDEECTALCPETTVQVKMECF